MNKRIVGIALFEGVFLLAFLGVIEIVNGRLLVSQRPVQRFIVLVSLILFLVFGIWQTLRYLWYGCRIYHAFMDSFGLEHERWRGIRKETALMTEGIAQIDQALEEQTALQNSEILIKKAELAALQSQINPHFLYNTLETIRGIALRENVRQIADMTEALSLLFRYSINTKDEFVTLGEDLENLDHYLLIQKYRFKDRFEVIKDFGEDEQVLDIEIPKLIIQPLVENAIYHGLETTTKKGFIKIAAFLTEDTLEISIEDNGVGMSAQMLEALNEKLRGGAKSKVEDATKGSGIALINVNERLHLYYGEDYGLSVYSTVGLGTMVKLILPYSQTNVRQAD